jgi:hypothetical protein
MHIMESNTLDMMYLIRLVNFFFIFHFLKMNLHCTILAWFNITTKIWSFGSSVCSLVYLGG